MDSVPKLFGNLSATDFGKQTLYAAFSQRFVLDKLCHEFKIRVERVIDVR